MSRPPPTAPMMMAAGSCRCGAEEAEEHTGSTSSYPFRRHNIQVNQMCVPSEPRPKEPRTSGIRAKPFLEKVNKEAATRPRSISRGRRCRRDKSRNGQSGYRNSDRHRRFRAACGEFRGMIPIVATSAIGGERMTAERTFGRGSAHKSRRSYPNRTEEISGTPRLALSGTRTDVSPSPEL